VGLQQAAEVGTIFMLVEGDGFGAGSVAASL